MFRIGLKKEEKEIIVRTINELQELRAELSFFKNTLAGMIPADRTVLPDRADTVLGGGETPEPDRACAGVNNQEQILHVPGGGDEVEIDPVREEQGPADGTGPGPAGPTHEAGPGGGAAVGETRPREDGPTAGSGEEEEEFAGPEKSGTVDGRKWAVVNLFERKRPWWKFWQDGGRTGRKTV